MTCAYRRFWSVVLGGRAVRVSAWDAHGDEHYAIVSDAGTGPERRERREIVAEQILRLVREGREGGEVGITEEVTA